MELVEGIHYEKISFCHRELLTIGGERFYCFLAANGTVGLIRRAHPEAFDDDLIRTGEAERAKGVSGEKFGRRKKRVASRKNDG